jgi:hypothetical protein
LQICFPFKFGFIDSKISIASSWVPSRIRFSSCAIWFQLFYLEPSFHKWMVQLCLNSTHGDSGFFKLWQLLQRWVKCHKKMKHDASLT